MPEDQIYAKLLDQHGELLTQLIVLQAQVNLLWVSFIILVFLQIVLIVAMLWAAVWSVQRVLKSNVERMKQLEDQFVDHRADNRSTLELIVRTIRGGQIGNQPT